MTNIEIPTNCPNCKNHCSIATLRCIKGRQWKMVLMRKLSQKEKEESNSQK